MRYQDLYDNSRNRYPSLDPLEIQILIQTVFNQTKAQYWIRKNDPVNDRTGLRRFYRYLNRLKTGEPLQYILKQSEFFGIPLLVGKGVLIPRPETELLVEKALQLIPKSASVLDIGAGTGAISIAMASNSDCTVVALEKYPQAFRILRRNIQKHGLNCRIKAVRADLFPESTEDPLDMIVSNPPYITERDWQNLDRKVRDFEPKSALTGGSSGLDIIKKIILNSKKYLKTGGHLLIEIGYDQGERVPELFREHDFNKVELINDYNGIGRIVTGQS